MSHKFEEGKDLIIDAVVEKLQKNLDGKQATCCAEFARQFFATVALDDLHDWSLDDLSGMVMNFWSLIQRRKPGEAKIRIYHPELEQDGWKKNHTVLEVICDDMPFLVNSLRMVVNRMHLGLHWIIHMGGVRLTRGKDNEVTTILPRQGSVVSDAITEAPIFLIIDRLEISIIPVSLFL